ncbi:MAG: hypothetical protein UIC65_00900 [Alphaproteobacteria bacterium]|nr:hypothetical protein [Alphaproteobacteria bacterium]
MSINREIENYRKIHNIPVFIMCNILNIETEMMYHKIKSGKIELDLYQKISFVEFTKTPLNL